MGAVTVNISFEKKLLDEVDRAARAEARSRSDLLREAARTYITRRERWGDVFALGRAKAAGSRLRPADVAAGIADWRRDKAGRR